MCGDDRQSARMFSYIGPEERVPPDHPLRPIREHGRLGPPGVVPGVRGLYSKIGRPSIPPEKLLRALLLQVLYSVRSERLLMEQLNYNLLFRWFVGLDMDDPVWDATVFTKNRDRLLEADIAGAFFTRSWNRPRRGAALQRALHGRRDADRGMGFAQELQEEGRSARPTTR